MLKYFFQIIVGLMLLQGQAFAGNMEYAAKDYPFKEDQRIFITYEYEVEENNGLELPLEKVLKDRVDKELVADKKLKKTGKVFVVESEEQRELTDEEYNEYVYGNYDARLRVIIKDLRDLVITTPAQYYDVPRTIYRYYTDANGNVYSYPITWMEHVYVPEKNEITPYCHVRFELIDLATDKVVWSREVDRNRGSSGPFTSSNQGFHDTFDYLVKKFLQDYKKELLKK